MGLASSLGHFVQNPIKPIGQGIHNLFTSEAGERNREMLKKDLARMDAGQLGLSGGEKRQAVGEATQAAGAVLQGQQAGINRQAGGSPFSAVSGRTAMLQQDLAETLGGATAQASAGVERASIEKAQAEANAIRAANEREQDRARQNAQFWGGKLFDTALDIGTMGLGGYVKRLAGGS